MEKPNLWQRLWQSFQEHWLLWLLTILAAAGIFFGITYLSGKKELAPNTTRIHTTPPCLNSLSGLDSSKYIKLSITYDCTDIDLLDVSTCLFNGQDLASRCFTYNDDRSAYVMDRYIKADPAAASYSFNTKVSSSKRGEKYTLAIAVLTAKGDTLVNYSKAVTLTLPNTIYPLTETLTPKAHAQKSTVLVVAGMPAGHRP